MDDRLRIPLSELWEDIRVMGLPVHVAGERDELWRVPLGASEYGHDGGNSGAPDNRGGDGPRSTPATDGISTRNRCRSRSMSYRSLTARMNSAARSELPTE